MPSPTPARSVIRFGAFEADPRTGELLKNGRRIHLQDHPFQVLVLLLDHHGDLVTREEFRQKLWPADTFVDFDVGLNTAIKKLRDALGDSAEHPRFIETLPRRGYRFLAPIDEPEAAETAPQETAEGQPPSVNALRRVPWHLFAAALLGLLLIGAVAALHSRYLAAKSPVIRSLAVLPLENLSGDPSQEYFVDGVTDAVTTDLAQISALRVISRTSSMRYKGARKALPQVGRELNVDAVVLGTVVRSGNRVRVDVQLVHAATDRHLWAHSYQRDLNDVIGLQSDVAQAIASEIAAKLQPAEQARLDRRRPANAEAYEAYLLGRFFWTKRDTESVKKSISYYEQALAKDPACAEAYAGLADSYFLLGFGMASQGSGLPRKEAAAKGRAAALQAIQIDDSLAEAHAALGAINSGERKGPEAESALRRAIALNPNYANAHHWLALFLSSQGRLQEALLAIRRAHDLDPLSPNILRTEGMALTRLKRYTEAYEVIQKAIVLAPNQLNVQLTLADYYEARDMYREALGVYEKTVAMTHSPQSRLMVAYTLVKLGRTAEAHRISEELVKRVREDKTAFFFALISSAQGRTDDTLRWLERARVEDALQGVEVDNYRFGALRSDPRYQSWLKQVDPFLNVTAK